MSVWFPSFVCCLFVCVKTPPSSYNISSCCSFLLWKNSAFTSFLYKCAVVYIIDHVSFYSGLLFKCAIDSLHTFNDQFLCVCSLCVKMVFSISQFLFLYCMSYIAYLQHSTLPLLWNFFVSFFVCFCRSLTSNLPNVNLPNVNLQIPKVPNLPVPVAGLSVNLPQMPSFSTPSWMAAIYDSECVFNAFT